MKKYHLVSMGIYVELDSNLSKVGKRIILKAIRKGRYDGEVVVNNLLGRVVEVEHIYLTKYEAAKAVIFSNVPIQEYEIKSIDYTEQKHSTDRKMDSREDIFLADFVDFGTRTPEGPTLELFDHRERYPWGIGADK